MNMQLKSDTPDWLIALVFILAVFTFFAAGKSELAFWLSVILVFADIVMVVLK